jgi:hypothetical protein
MSGKGLGAEDVVLLAGELGSMAGLTELNLRHAKLESVGAAAVAVGLRECVPLLKLTISGEDGKNTGYIKQAACSGSNFQVGATCIVQNESRPCRVTRGADSSGNLRVRACGAVATMEVGMAELDVRSTGHGAAGAVAAVVAGFLPRCTTLWKLTISGDGGVALTIEACTKELNLSGKGLGAARSTLVASFLPRCEVLTKVNLSGNNIFGTHTPPTNNVCECYDFDVTAVSFLVINAFRSANLQQLEFANNNMNASAAQHLGDGLRLLKEAGTLGSALRCIKLHDNPLTHGDQDTTGRNYDSSVGSREASACGISAKSHTSLIASSWERSIAGLQSAVLAQVRARARSTGAS